MFRSRAYGPDGRAEARRHARAGTLFRPGWRSISYVIHMAYQGDHRLGRAGWLPFDSGPGVTGSIDSQPTRALVRLACRPRPLCALYSVHALGACDPEDRPGSRWVAMGPARVVGLDSRARTVGSLSACM